MKAKTHPKFLAMMAAGALAINIGGIGAAHAQGMPADAQQLVQTMRPMYISQATPDQDQTTATTATTTPTTPTTPTQQTDDSAYGGMPSGTSASASGRRQGSCSDMPRCDVFFGQ